MSTTGTTTVDDLKSLYGEYESALNSQYAKASSELKRQYDQSMGVVDQSRKGSRQAASISLDKLKKYLPEQLAAEGLGNLGMSQTAYVRAQNNYQNQLASIESDANAKRAELYNNYANNLSALEQSKTRDLLDLYGKRDAAIYQAERDDISDARYEDEQTKDKQAALYDEVMEMMQSGSFNNTAELEEYLYGTDKDGDGKPDGGAYDELDEYQKLAVNMGYNYIKNNPEQIELDNQYNSGDGTITKSNITLNNNGWWIFGNQGYTEGDNFSVIDVGDPNSDSDDKKYRIESTGEVVENAETIKKKARDAGVALDEVFGYEGNLYIIHDNKLYGIQARSNTYNKAADPKRKEGHYSDLYNAVFSTKEKQVGSPNDTFYPQTEQLETWEEWQKRMGIK